jgi:hypothetical protein
VGYLDLEALLDQSKLNYLAEQRIIVDEQQGGGHAGFLIIKVSRSGKYQMANPFEPSGRPAPACPAYGTQARAVGQVCIKYQISNMKLILHGIIIESKHYFCM